LFLVAVLLLGQVSSFINVENINLKEALPNYEEQIRDSSGGMLALASKLGFGLDQLTPEKLGKLTTSAMKMGIGVARTIFSEGLLSFVLLMFLVQSVPSLIQVVETRAGAQEAQRLQDTFQKIEGDIIVYFATKSAMSLGTAAGTAAVLFLFGAKYMVISLTLVFILNFIPLIGSVAAVGIILVLYIVSFGLTVNAAWLFFCLMAVQVFFGSVLEPKIAGSRLNISPIVIILSLSLWGWIWGIIGMLISVPLTIFIKIILMHVGPLKTDDSCSEPAVSPGPLK
jgi:AI-2 transport protein TqsA